MFGLRLSSAGVGSPRHGSRRALLRGARPRSRSVRYLPRPGGRLASRCRRPAAELPCCHHTLRMRVLIRPAPALRHFGIAGRRGRGARAPASRPSPPRRPADGGRALYPPGRPDQGPGPWRVRRSPHPGWALAERTGPRATRTAWWRGAPHRPSYLDAARVTGSSPVSPTRCDQRRACSGEIRNKPFAVSDRAGSPPRAFGRTGVVIACGRHGRSRCSWAVTTSQRVTVVWSGLVRA